MREIEPQQAGGRFSGVAHVVMVVGPYDGDEKVAHGITEPCGPEREQRLGHTISCTSRPGGSPSRLKMSSPVPLVAPVWQSSQANLSPLVPPRLIWPAMRLKVEDAKIC